jgi:L-Ala-D/L-Glu epimerase
MAEQIPSLKLLTLRLKESFNLSKGSTSEKTTLIARWRNGVGEGSPSVHYGLPAHEIEMELRKRLDLLADCSADTLSGIIRDLPESLNVGRCALDMAMLDSAAKERGMPLYRYLGLDKPARTASSFTVTADDERSLQSQLERAEAFDCLKLKVGFEHDADFVDYILKHKECRLRLDANGGWSVAETIERIQNMRGYPIDFIEQPTTSPSLVDIDKIRTKTDCRLFLDESIITLKDVIQFAPVVSGINIKLAKCGGITRSLAMIEEARKHNLELLLGCMIETTIGITAALHLASLCDYFDLDSILLTENDPFWGAHFDGQYIMLPEGNGIAVTMEDNTLV